VFQRTGATLPRVLPSVLAVLVVGSVAIAARQRRDTARLFDLVLERIRVANVDSLSDSTLYANAARGLVRELNDPYADLYSSQEMAEFSRNTLGNDYGGLGLGIESLADSITVTNVFRGSPAALAGMQAGDRIVAVDDVSIVGWTTDRTAQRLTGTAGSAVRVSFVHGGSPVPVTDRFVRAIVHVPAVPYALLLDGHVGYVSLQRFSGAATAEVQAAIAKLEQDGATAFILDLRGNPGGELSQALGVTNLFVDVGMPLATVRSRAAVPELYTAQYPPVVRGKPVIVLVDGYTASAAEIVAGALQDHDRALLVGTPSFGKGLVQTMFPLDGGWTLKMTTGRWFTPSGRSIHLMRQFERGHFISTDTLPPARTPMAVRTGRPTVHSDAGRVLYGGGGIVPDVLVWSDTLAAPEQHFVGALVAHPAAAQNALFSVARDLKGTVAPDFAPRPAWRAIYEARLRAAGIAVAPALLDSAGAFVDAMIGNRVADLAFGDSAAFARTVPRDAQLLRAVSLLHQAPTLAGLLEAAGDGKG